MDSLPSATAAKAPPTADETLRMRKFLLTGAVLLVGFGLPLFKLVTFALHSELYSFIVIVPFISAYLVWSDSGRFYPGGLPVTPLWTIGLTVLGAGLLLWALLLYFLSAHHAQIDLLALCMYSFVSLLAAAACHHLGRHTLRIFAFPLGFLVFLAPFPVAVETGVETILQHGSSWVAHTLFDVASMPVFRNGTFFQLPGFSMQVAPECSGIRSTLALFLTSLVAGQMFLRSPWKRALLALLVLPVALLRNGFRVFVIGELCVKIGPHMIDSWIHRHGGPAFFALSLVPFSLLLYFFYKTDLRAAAAAKSTPSS